MRNSLVVMASVAGIEVLTNASEPVTSSELISAIVNAEIATEE